MSKSWTKPCPKCGSRRTMLQLGGEGRPWILICEACGLERWFEDEHRAYEEFIEHDENGMVHFGEDGLTMEFKLVEVAE